MAENIHTVSPRSVSLLSLVVKIFLKTNNRTFSSFDDPNVTYLVAPWNRKETVRLPSVEDWNQARERDYMINIETLAKYLHGEKSYSVGRTGFLSLHG